MIACSNTLQTKKIITKAKKIQTQQRINRQARQTQQKDARQNIINKRRGVQVTVQAMLTKHNFSFAQLDDEFTNIDLKQSLFCMVFYLLDSAMTSF